MSLSIITTAAVLACSSLVVDATTIARRTTINSYDAGEIPNVFDTYGSTHAGCYGIEPCSDYSNVIVTEDPEDDSIKVLRVKYDEGEAAGSSGAQFYTTEIGDDDTQDGEAGTLEYEVYFPSWFDFTKGGKLPGLHGGEDRVCSGGRSADGENCFSARLMWREEGAGETYFYLPFSKQRDSFCKEFTYPSMDDGCTSTNYGSYQRGNYYWNRGQWNTVKQYIELNTAGKTDGVYRLTVNGVLAMESDVVYYRKTSNLKLEGMFFSTFFGGSSSQYEPDSDQYAYFKNISVRAGYEQNEE
eukprot:CFRG7347T1